MFEANRQPRTMDNPYYEWSPIVARPPLAWPNGAHVAVAVIVHVEQAEWLPAAGAHIPPSLVHRGPYPQIPDVHEISPHEYGNRVGVFRVMKALDDHGVRAMAAIDAGAASSYPFIIQECQVRNWEFIGHGVSASQMLTELMTESEERTYIAQSIEAIAAATGKRPAGWASVEFAESSRTVRLLAEQGIRYVCDWPNDEQPYRMRVPVGEMVSLPVTIELDDIFALRLRRLPAPKLGQMMKEAFDRLYHDGAGAGRLLVLSVHPWMIGQPFRIRHWMDALQYIAGHRKVWFATGSEIVNWFLAQTA